MNISVVICSYNPRKDILQAAIDALKAQTLQQSFWELILIDNNSTEKIAQWLDLSWHRQAKIVLEPKPGLSHARLSGVKNASYGLIVFVDDDNVLSSNYLEVALKFAVDHPEVGCFGGKSVPKFEITPPDWFFQTGINLGCQDFGDTPFISDFRAQKGALTTYPEKAPIGTGMVITKDAFNEYIKDINESPTRLELGRKGESLASGEDNDIILTIVEKGFEIAYVPDLYITHLIPSIRLNAGYLKKMAYSSNLTWIKVLNMHDIRPWPKISRKSVLARQLKAFFSTKAWKSETHFIKWRGACGTFQGLSEI